MVSTLLLDNDVTFLHRSFQRDLGPIPINDVAQSMLETIEEGGRAIDPEALSIAAQETGGCAFLIQLIGYYLWRQHPRAHEISRSDVQGALMQATREMERAVFRPTLMELSERERQYLEAMVRCGSPSPTAKVARIMDVSASNASNIRSRLIDRGIIAPCNRGKVGFDIPLLRDYLSRETS